MSQKFLIGSFDDDQVLLHAIEKIRAKGIKIHDVLTPFPVHGIEEVLDMKASRIDNAGFFFGLFGTCCAFFGITWVLVVNWPLNFDGKPHFAFPAWIPIMFEFTVLNAAFGMFFTWMYRCNIFPGKFPKVLEPRSTDDRFVVAFKINEETQSSDIEGWKSILKETGAVEVKEAED
jgi:hypothetical protein